MTQQARPGDGLDASAAPQVEKPVSSYPHSEDHAAVWGTDLPSDTPIGRAWARLFDQGLNLGSPTSREYSLPSAGGDEVRQNFQFGYALLMPDPSVNVNLTVRFMDGRGFIAQESGI